MANITNTLGFVTNPQFSGGEAITPLTGADFAYANRGYGGIYVGTPGTLVVKTINGNVLTLVSASGFIPGLIGAVSSSSTAANIIGFDPQPVAPATTTTSTSTSTSTTTAAPVTAVAITLYSGSYSGNPASSPSLTGPGSVCYLSQGPGYPGATSLTVYVPDTTLWGPAGPASIQAYTDSGLTTLFTGGAYADLNAWGSPLTFPIPGSGTVRFFDQATDAFIYPTFC